MAEPGEIVEFGEVLVVGGDTPQLGTPTVSGATVAGEVLQHTRGDKVIAFKKRRRKNSRRKRGYRHEFSVIRITEILTGGAKPSKKPPPRPKREAKAKGGSRSRCRRRRPSRQRPRRKKPAKAAAKKPAKARLQRAEEARRSEMIPSRNRCTRVSENSRDHHGAQKSRRIFT